MATKLPDFVTKQFLEPIIKKQFDHSDIKIKLIRFWGEPATKPGDNYASDMYLIHLELEILEQKVEKSIILKVLTRMKRV
jgi:hypothetical protein